MQDLVDHLSTLLLEKNMKLVTAESCTGGLLAAGITYRPGASNVLERGFITYSNEAKAEMLGIPMEIIEKHGAVSAQTAEAMAIGAIEKSHADLAVSITGIAGPDGGSDEKPVGTVYFGYKFKEGVPVHRMEQFEGTRNEIQTQAANAALEHLIAILEQGRKTA